MIKRLVKMTFRSEATEEFIKIFAESKDLIRAFEGCEHVELLRDENDTRIFFTLSLWKGAEDLEKYRHSELFKRTWSRTKVLFDDKPQAWSTKLVESGSLNR